MRGPRAFHSWALLALLVVCSNSCNAVAFKRFESHAASVTIGLAGGALAVATGGTVAIAFLAAGLLGGVVVGQTMEPEPVTTTRTVTTIIKFRTDADGKTTEETKSYTDEHPSTSPPEKGDDRWPKVPDLGLWGELKRAFLFAWYLLLAGVVIGWLLRHTHLIVKLWRAFVGGTGLAVRAVDRLREGLKSSRPRTPPPST